MFFALRTWNKSIYKTLASKEYMVSYLASVVTILGFTFSILLFLLMADAFLTKDSLAIIKNANQPIMHE